MDLLAARAHSESELREKLQATLAKNEDLSAQEISEAIEDAVFAAKKNNWLIAPAELSENIAQDLHRRQKGIEYINAYLENKGLPTIAMDSELELEKARAIMKNKYRLKDDNEPQEFSEGDLAKMGQLLTSRGFDPETVRKAIYEKL